MRGSHSGSLLAIRERRLVDLQIKSPVPLTNRHNLGLPRTYTQIYFLLIKRVGIFMYLVTRSISPSPLQFTFWFLFLLNVWCLAMRRFSNAPYLGIFPKYLSPVFLYKCQLTWRNSLLKYPIKFLSISAWRFSNSLLFLFLRKVGLPEMSQFRWFR